MNKFKAKVLKIDKDVEDIITVEIDGVTLTCFANICPYQINVGKDYNIEISFEVFSEYIVEEVPEPQLAITQSENCLPCWFIGKHCGKKLQSVITFEDEILLSEFAYLEGKYIRMKVDRVDVEFL